MPANEDTVQRGAWGHPAERASSAHALLLRQLRAIERGQAPMAPRPLAAAARAAATGPVAVATPRKRNVPWPLHLALGALLLAAAAGLGGSGATIAVGQPVRLNVVSFARAADGRLQVRTAAAGARSGAPLVAGTDRIERPGRPTWITVRDIDIDAPVTEAGLVLRGNVPTWEVVANAVAHYDGSAVPGENGNVVLAGHLNTPLSRQGAVFRNLPQAKVGQVIQIWSGDTRYTYTIDSVRLVEPQRTEVMAPTDEPKLTLITCYPDVKFSQRLVVTATYTPGP